MKKLSKKQLQILHHKQTKIFVVVGGAITLVCFLIGYALLQTTVVSMQPKRLVTVYDGGGKRSVLVRTSTVRGALEFAGIPIYPHDVVEPKLDSRLTKPYMDIIVYRSRPVIVIDGAVRQTTMTSLQSPNEIMKAVGRPGLKPDDKSSFERGELFAYDAPTRLVVKRAAPEPVAAESTPEPEPEPKVAFAPKPNALTRSKGAQIYTDINGVAHRETYYDLPMNIVIGLCGGGSYSIRADGAKVDQDGYVLVAAGFAAYPRCTVVDTSMGPGKVYDTGGFAQRHPYGFDLATDWSNYDGR